jgi:hypothetical protein
MKVQAFYNALFAPLVARHGPLDAAALTAIVGFDAGGPISLCTIGHDRHAPRSFTALIVSAPDTTTTSQSPSQRKGNGVSLPKLTTIASCGTFSRSLSSTGPAARREGDTCRDLA